MAKGGINWRWLGSAAMAAVCLAVALGVAYSLFGSRPNAEAVAIADTTASVDRAIRVTGPSGLPLPRFVSLKADKVNVRRGPSSDHKVAWVYQRKGLPIEIVAEFDNWRRVRDSDGDEGWVLQNMLVGKRTAIVAPWRPGQTIPIYSGKALSDGVVARLSSGVVGEVESCTGDWCRVSAAGYDGYIEQIMLWGVYPGEIID
jgi:SH3-like domain-containing protein